MSDHALIGRRIDAIRRRISNSCRRAGRLQESVRLLLATKTVSPDRIKLAIGHGARLIGENRAQELIQKAPALEGCSLERHFIGHVQSNKLGKIIDLVTCIQSVDRLSIAEKLSEALKRKGKQIEVFLQINTSGEDSKFGVTPDEAVDFARRLSRLDNLRVRGLMTIGLFSPDPEECRPSLRLLRTLRDRILAAGIKGVEPAELSMGMSHDLEVAIEEGATLVRVGTAVFGERPTPEGFFWNEDVDRPAT